MNIVEKGFTPIEWMIVVAIVGILAAIPYQLTESMRCVLG